MGFAEGWLGQEKIPRIGKFLLGTDEAEQQTWEPFDRTLRNQGRAEGKSRRMRLFVSSLSLHQDWSRAHAEGER
jgi:hypothetical protein